MIRSKVIQGKVTMIFVVDKVSRARLRWFEHMKRRCKDTAIMRCERLVTTVIKRGGPKKNWGKMITQNNTEHGTTSAERGHNSGRSLENSCVVALCA